jgi:hypothetical protein
MESVIKGGFLQGIWVEKYRPTQFDDIVLDPLNRKLFSNILKPCTNRGDRAAGSPRAA